jgi:branched-chain amino acid transport system permease protein
MSPSRRPRLTWVWWLLAAAAIGLAHPAPAAAQDGGEASTTSTTTAPIAVFGHLEDPASGPVDGVTIEVHRDGELIGSDETDRDGDWRVPVPGEGRYSIALETSTLPDGVALRDADRSTLDEVRVLPGRDKRVSFLLGTRRTTSTSPEGNRVVNTIWSGLVVGLVIALCSIGLSLVFGTTGLVNFAHGEMVTLGALVAWWASSDVGPKLALPLAGLVAVVVTGLAGMASDRVRWRPLERRRLALVSMMIVSIGLSMLLRYSYAVVFEANPRPYREYAAQPPWDLGPLLAPPKQLVVAALAVVVLAGYGLSMQRTRLGTAIRAVADNRDLSEASGIDVRRVVMVVWILGSALAGLGGVAYSTLNGVQWDQGYRLLLPIFAAVVLGGLGTAYGAVAGGLAIGLVSELSTLWFPAEFKFAWALGVLIVVLIFRPQGILGRAERVG